MSAKKKYKKKPSVAQTQVVEQPEVQLVSQITPSQLNFILPAIVAIITFIVYRHILGNQFLNDWDDWIYVTKDPFIKSFSPHNIQMMLFHNITQNYFHPLTMLSLAMNYHFSKLEPEAYYITNLLIHCGATVFVYFLTKILLEEMSARYGYGEIKNIPWLAAMAALFHGVHPMHVESVAWIAERKDVTYSFFYFAGLIAYVRYLRSPNTKALMWVVVLYIASLMGKPLAVSFPLSLFAIDFLFKRQGIKGLIIEKWPFFAVSALGGLLVFITVSKSGSMAFLHGFSAGSKLLMLGNKLMVPCYSFLMYFVKAFAPFKLCGYYPYPPVTKDGYLPLFSYMTPLFCAALVFIPLFLAKKAGENYFRVVGFGLAFYLANVLFILQFLSAGVAIMAERYSYVAYFGIFFMVTYFVGLIIQKSPAYKVPVIAVVGIFIGSLAYICNDRTRVWHNSETFWHDVAAKYPKQWLVPYMNLGQYYVDRGELDSAFTNYKILAELGSKVPETYRNLANIYGTRKEFDKAIPLYTQALKYDSSGGGDIYLDRAVTYSMMGRLDLALPDYDRAYAKDTNSEKILGNRAYAYLSVKQYDSSIADYNHLLRINPSEPSYYMRRGAAELNKGDIARAMPDFNKALSMQPNNGECLYDMSVAYNVMKDYKNALTSALKAKQLGYPVADSYMAEIQKNASTIK